MIISIKKNWLEVESQHRKFLKCLLSNYFLDCRGGNSKHASCYDFLRKNHKYITSNKIDDYIKSINNFKAEIAKNAHDPTFQSVFKEDLKFVLDYSEFSKKTGDYNAYSLCSKSITKTCPYCNHYYAFTIQRFKRGFRPTLDHYYDKATYPHLALSLYNLVPSCYSCNSSLKGSRDFFKKVHLHPLFDEESLSFTLNKTDLSFCNPDDLLLIESNLLSLKISSSNEKEENTIETFLINERYGSFVSDALTFAQNKRMFDDLKLNDQITITQEMKEDVSLRFNKDNYKNEMLGKLFLDIYNQFSQT